MERRYLASKLSLGRHLGVERLELRVPPLRQNKFYQVDGPGLKTGVSQIQLKDVTRQNFKSWLQVSFNGVRPGPSAETRASENIYWHSITDVYAEPPLPSAWKRTEGGINVIGPGHVPIPRAQDPEV